MRVGLNPLLQAKAPVQMPPIVEAVITHLPDLRQDYHARRLQVIQKSLNSMRKNDGHGGLPSLVWDNGSCKELIDWLQNVYKPTWLIRSPNIGKSNARAAIFRMFPAETIIAKADDDILYYPGWLDPQLQILNAFPNVGKVSGWPVRRSMGINNGTTLEWAKKNAILETGRFISDQEEADYATSIGNAPESIAKMFAHQQDYIANYQGMKAYCTSQHCQFVARAGVIATFAQWNEMAMQNERPFDKAINDAGLLRLTTVQRYTRHIGNVWDAEFEIETKGWGI